MSGTSNMKQRWEDIRVLRARKLDIGIANSEERGVKGEKRKEIETSPRKKKGHFALQLCFRKSRKRKMGVFYGKVAKSSTFFGISNSPPNSVSQLCSFLGLWSGFLNVQGTILCREQKSVVNRFVSKLL